MSDREIENRYSKFMSLNYINIYFKDWKFNSNYVYEAFKKFLLFYYSNLLYRHVIFLKQNIYIY